MPESYTPREFINKINAENPGPVFDPYGVEGLVTVQDQEPSVAKDLIAKARAENSPEAKIAELQQQLDAMKQWLIQDGTYTEEEIEAKIVRLKVEYNQDIQEAEVVGNIQLIQLETAKGLKFPKNIRGDIDLTQLTYLEEVILPQRIIGNIGLYCLEKIEGKLILPDYIEGDLIFNNLKTFKNLKFPTEIEGVIFVSRNINPVELGDLRDDRPDLLDKIYFHD